jgi:hypothetical protein
MTNKLSKPQAATKTISLGCTYIVKPKSVQPRKKELYIFGIPTNRANTRRFAEFIMKLFADAGGGHLSGVTLKKKTENGLYYYEGIFSKIEREFIPFLEPLEYHGITTDELVLLIANYGEPHLLGNEIERSVSSAIATDRNLIILVTRDEISESDMQRIRLHFILKKSLIIPLSQFDLLLMSNIFWSEGMVGFNECLVDKAHEVMPWK